MTKSGSNAYHGTAFEFLRNEALNARNLFASTNPIKPLFRRNQFDGVFGGPVQHDHTFFFVDYQGQRQTIGRTVISTVPTVQQRQGIFTEAIDGRVPVIYDPSTGTARSPFPNNTVPADRIGPVARALLERYPLPTSDGTANNYRRVGNEVNDQNQFDIRIDQHVTNRDQAFARVSHFREQVSPVTSLPDGSGLTTGTPGPQSTSAWAFASNYRHIFSDRLLNELRVGDTRRTVKRTATNAPPLGNPNGILGTPAFGSITSAGDPRVIQLAIKFIF